MTQDGFDATTVLIESAKRGDDNVIDLCEKTLQNYLQPHSYALTADDFVDILSTNQERCLTLMLEYSDPKRFPNLRKPFRVHQKAYEPAMVDRKAQGELNRCRDDPDATRLIFDQLLFISINKALFPADLLPKYVTCLAAAQPRCVLACYTVIHMLKADARHQQTCAALESIILAVFQEQMPDDVICKHGLPQQSVQLGDMQLVTAFITDEKVKRY